MGAWGHGPVDSDQALDWLWGPARRAADCVRDLVIRSEGNEAEFAHELRGAGELMRRIGGWLASEDLELCDKLADKLALIKLDRDWLAGWDDADAVVASLEREIEELRTYA